MACYIVDVPPKLKSELLDEWAQIKDQDGLPVEAAWYRMQAQKVRSITDADVLRSRVNGDHVLVEKDHVVGLSGETMFMCGEGLELHLCGCGADAGFLCDKPIGDGKTCDMPICDKCRIHGTNGRQRWDYCPRH